MMDAGSPQKAKRIGAKTQPFFLQGGASGALLIHGFLTAPDEMRPLGDYLADGGMTVYGIRLRGHGTSPGDLATVSWRDWLEDVHAGLGVLRRECDRVSLVGLSLGAALALHAATETPVHRVVGLSTPDATLARRVHLGWVNYLARVCNALPKIGSDIRDPASRKQHFTYTRIPLDAVAQLQPLLEHTQERLPQVSVPTLLVHAKKDRVIPPHVARRVATRLGGPHRIVWLEQGGHTVTLDYDRQHAWEATRMWLEQDSP
ncbi:MAG: alpha/beta fold hydrolase [Anaerolineae bacterium]|nr:alpha/beta fold hydrolase [Anaerolineae bacterium]